MAPSESSSHCSFFLKVLSVVLCLLRTACSAQTVVQKREKEPKGNRMPVPVFLLFPSVQRTHKHLVAFFLMASPLSSRCFSYPLVISSSHGDKSNKKHHKIADKKLKNWKIKPPGKSVDFDQIYSKKNLTSSVRSNFLGSIFFLGGFFFENCVCLENRR